MMCESIPDSMTKILLEKNTLLLISVFPHVMVLSVIYGYMCFGI
jgi:hypothetical protein